MKNEDIIIWGAGAIGKVAYTYYKDRCNILAFVDSDCSKWGEYINAVIIRSPEILKEKQNVKVVIAVKRGIEAIENRLIEKYQVGNYLIFKVEEDRKESKCRETIEDNKPTIVSFGGGLGNQLFQYAFMLALKSRGKNVYADISSYANVGRMPFVLTEVFENVHLQYADRDNWSKCIGQLWEYPDAHKIITYKEPVAACEISEKCADMSLLDCTAGFFEGIFQTYKFAELMKDVLLEELVFPVRKNEELIRISKWLQKEQIVSVHIRRGDYLKENLVRYYGNICTTLYYDKAMRYMMDAVGMCRFCFFSDDIAWVKEHYDLPDAIYIGEEMFEHYEDWYDMYLMSICKHNIIANSTFSWWGAWLNQNPDRVVVAPKKWFNGCEYKDIYPTNWICISGGGEEEMI